VDCLRTQVCINYLYHLDRMPCVVEQTDYLLLSEQRHSVCEYGASRCGCGDWPASSPWWIGIKTVLALVDLLMGDNLDVAFAAQWVYDSGN
jgi:hypothetical protein